MSYEDGFEDAVELCLKEIMEAKEIDKAVSRIQHILGLVKEDKFERIKCVL